MGSRAPNGSLHSCLLLGFLAVLRNRLIVYATRWDLSPFAHQRIGWSRCGIVGVETTAEANATATATAMCTSRDKSAKGVYMVPGRFDDEAESTTSWVDVVRSRSKAVNGKQSSSKRTLFTNRKK
jgi:hypothetical protein